jgi:hypothetical protein
MSLLDAVEYITADPARRIALYTHCSAEDRTVNGMSQNDPRVLKIVSLVDQDLALLERRAQAEGFQVQGCKRDSALEGSRTGPARVLSPLLFPTAHNSAVALWTTSKNGLRLVCPG